MLYLLNRIEIPADVEHKAAVMIEGSVIDAEAWNFAAIGQQDLLQRLQRVKETGLPGGRDADLLLGNLYPENGKQPAPWWIVISFGSGMICIIR